MLPPDLVSALRCPKSGGELIYFPDAEGIPGFGPGFLLCPESRLKYPVDELDFPVLLIEEAVTLTAEEVAELTSHL